MTGRVCKGDDSNEGLGVARFIRSPDDPAVAEIAVAVVDDWQGRGLGTALLQGLTERACDEGVERFSAVVLAENEPMMDLLRRLVDVQVIGRDGGVIELLMDLADEGIQTPSGTPSAAQPAATSTSTPATPPWTADPYERLSRTG